MKIFHKYNFLNQQIWHTCHHYWAHILSSIKYILVYQDCEHPSSSKLRIPLDNSSTSHFELSYQQHIYINHLSHKLRIHNNKEKMKHYIWGDIRLCTQYKVEQYHWHYWDGNSSRKELGYCCMHDNYISCWIQL